MDQVHGLRFIRHAVHHHLYMTDDIIIKEERRIMKHMPK